MHACTQQSVYKHVCAHHVSLGIQSTASYYSTMYMVSTVMKLAVDCHFIQFYLLLIFIFSLWKTFSHTQMHAMQRSYVIITQCTLQSIQHFLDNPHILEYIAQLGSQKLHAGDSWFTRVETTMLADMLKLLKVVLPATVSVSARNLLSFGIMEVGMF